RSAAVPRPLSIPPRRSSDLTLARGRELGYVETLLGRRRSVLELRSGDRAVREAAERMTYNMPVQGTAADIMKIAMLRVAPALAALGGRLLLQVHDEIVAEVPEANAERAAAEVGRLMPEAYPLRVPLVASVGLGRAGAEQAGVRARGWPAGRGYGRPGASSTDRRTDSEAGSRSATGAGG